VDLPIVVDRWTPSRCPYGQGVETAFGRTGARTDFASYPRIVESSPWPVFARANGIKIGAGMVAAGADTNGR
jgi:hypothetical protein